MVYIPFTLIIYFPILIGGSSEDTVTTLQSEHFEPEGMMIMEGQDTVPRISLPSARLRRSAGLSACLCHS